MTEHKFVTVYRGTPVPESLVPNLGSVEASWFRKGVDAVLDQDQARDETLNTLVYKWPARVANDNPSRWYVQGGEVLFLGYAGGFTPSACLASVLEEDESLVSERVFVDPANFRIGGRP